MPDGDDDDDALNNREIAAQDRLDQKGPCPGQREDCLRHRGASIETRDADAEDTQQGQQRVSGMHPQDPGLQQPFCPGRSDVVTVEGLQHLRARQSCQVGEVRGAQGDRRKHQGAEVANRILGESNGPRRGQDAEVESEREDEQDGDPEIRRGGPDRGQHTDAEIHRGVCSDGSKDAEPERETEGQQKG